MADITLAPLPPIEAIRFLRSKGFQPGYHYLDVFQEDHAHAFTVAKMMQLDLLMTMHESLAKAIEEGTPYEAWAKDITPILQKEGWWGRKPMTDPLTGETEIVQLGSPRRLRIIYNTNLRSARAAGRWERIQRDKAYLPYLRYSAILDSHTRPQHRAWGTLDGHGIILPVDHVFWESHFPPNGWNCRCRCTQISAGQLRRKGWKVSSETEVAAFLQGEREFINKRTGERSSAYPGIDIGFNFNIGKAHLRGVGHALGNSLAAADPAMARQVLQKAMDGESFDSFVRNPGAWTDFPVALLDDNLQAKINAGQKVVYLSDETWAKQLERHPEILPAHYRRLPGIVADPDLVIQDGEQTIVLIRMGEEWLWAAVKATGTGRANFLTSYRITKQADIDRKLRQGGRIVYRKEEEK